MKNLKNILENFNDNFEFTLFDSINFNILYSKLHDLSKFTPSNLPTLNNTIFKNWNQ
jgi:hypothetical protein